MSVVSSQPAIRTAASRASPSVLTRLRIQIDADRDRLRLHDADRGGVQLRHVGLALAGAPVVGRERRRSADAPAAAALHAHARVRADVPDVGSALAVLGHDPERVAVEALADGCATRLAGLAAGRLEDARAREREAELVQRLDGRVGEVLAGGRADSMLSDQAQCRTRT